MSTLTPRLQLKRPDGSDPFLRADIIDALNKLDATPGHHICTSTSRPNWGVAQAGRAIRETDTRTEWEWSGTAWLPLLTATSGWLLGASPNTFQAGGSTVTHSLGSITTTRPGTLLLNIATAASCLDTAHSYYSATALVGGVPVGDTYGIGYVQWTGSNNNGSNYDVRTLHTTAYRAVMPGTHSIGLRTVVSSGGLSVSTMRIAASITLINDTSR